LATAEATRGSFDRAVTRSNRVTSLATEVTTALSAPSSARLPTALRSSARLVANSAYVCDVCPAARSVLASALIGPMSMRTVAS
jgi:hypothetical protein